MTRDPRYLQREAAVKAAYLLAHPKCEYCEAPAVGVVNDQRFLTAVCPACTSKGPIQVERTVSIPPCENC